MSLVKTESGAVSLGVLDLSSLLFFSLLVRGAGDLETLDLPVLSGESVRRVERPLLVRMPSLAVLERGVGGLCTYDCSSWYTGAYSPYSVSSASGHHTKGKAVTHIDSKAFHVFMIRRKLLGACFSIVLCHCVKTVVIFRRRPLMDNGS